MFPFLPPMPCYTESSEQVCFHGNHTVTQGFGTFSEPDYDYQMLSLLTHFQTPSVQGWVQEMSKRDLGGHKPDLTENLTPRAPADSVEQRCIPPSGQPGVLPALAPSTQASLWSWGPWERAQRSMPSSEEK